VRCVDVGEPRMMQCLWVVRCVDVGEPRMMQCLWVVRCVAGTG